MRIMMAYFENLVNIAGGLERTLCRLSNYFYNDIFMMVVKRAGHNLPFCTSDRPAHLLCDVGIRGSV